LTKPKDKLDPLAFIDYYRLREAIKSKDQEATPSISLHDGEVISYYDAWKTMSHLSDDLINYNNSYNSMTIDVIGVMLEVLQTRGVLTSDDMDKIQNKIKNEWSNYQDGK